MESGTICSIVNVGKGGIGSHPCMLYMGLPLKGIWKLRQNNAAGLLSGASYGMPMTPNLFELCWLPICPQVQFKVLVITGKALNGLSPGSRKDCLPPHESARQLRSSGEALLRVPALSDVWLASTRDRAFSVTAPRPWNSLPRGKPSLLVIQRLLKMWLFHRAFYSIDCLMDFLMILH